MRNAERGAGKDESGMQEPACRSFGAGRLKKGALKRADSAPKATSGLDSAAPLGWEKLNWSRSVGWASRIVKS